MEQNGVHFVICETCLAPYAWLPPKGGRKPHRISGVGPPYPCPRCGSLQRANQHEMAARTYRTHAAVQLALAAALVVFTALVYIDAEARGKRPWGPWSVGVAVFLAASSLVLARRRRAQSFDPQEGVDVRRDRARKAALDPAVVPFEEFSTRLGGLGLDLPDPPAWDWNRAQHVQAARPWGRARGAPMEILVGTSLAAVVLVGAWSYLESTRIAWEFDRLDNPHAPNRWESVESLWRTEEGGDREGLIEWFRRTPLSAEEEQAFLARIPRVGPDSPYLYDLIEGIVRAHYGAPGVEASDLLRRFPDVSKGVLEKALNRDAVPQPRLAVLAATALSEGRIDWIRTNIEIDDSILQGLRSRELLTPAEWNELARHLLAERRNEPAVWLDRLESFLARVPRDWWRSPAEEAFASLTPMMTEWVAQNPGKYPHLLRAGLRPEWAVPLARSIGDRTDRVPAVLEAAKLFENAPHSLLEAFDEVTAASEESVILTAAAAASRGRPETAARLCGAVLESHLIDSVETLDPQAIQILEARSRLIADLAEVVDCATMGSLWLAHCTPSLRFPPDGVADSSPRAAWFHRLRTIPPDEILEGYRDSVSARREVPTEEVDGFAEFLVGIPACSGEWAARSLARIASSTSTVSAPATLKFALLRYIEHSADAKALPYLTALSGDPTVLNRTRADSRSGSPLYSTILLGEYAAKIAHAIAAQNPTVSETSPPLTP